MTEEQTNIRTLRRIFLFALAGAGVSSIYLEWLTVPARILFGGILGGLARLAFLASKKGASIGAIIGALVGTAILLDGIFQPIVDFELPFFWHQLVVLPFGVALGSAIGSILVLAQQLGGY